MKSVFKKAIFYSLFLINFLIIFTFWMHNSFSHLTLNVGSAFIALGRLFGLIAVYAILLQVLIIGRVRWLESVFGLDRLSIIHHLNGIAALGIIVVHPIFLIIGYSLLSHSGPISQFIVFFTGYRFVWLAVIAFCLFVIIVISSIIIVRKRLKYETWYYIHILVYAAILSAFFHQIAVGGDFVQASFRVYWRVLYLFVLINLLIYRFIKPIFNYVRFRFKVEGIVKETDNAVSIYISGKSIQYFRVHGGQFIIVRFLSKKFWSQAHPFSISGIAHNHIRITVKNVGDYTREIHTLIKGTPVIIDGPHGIFKLNQALGKKFLFIAGGVGITPIRSMLEECRNKDKDIILLYANRKKSDIIFYEEILHLTRVSDNIKAVNILSEPETGWKGERGRIDEEKIARLVNDISEREVYICGPKPMMDSMITLMRKHGVDDKNIHYERFSL